MKTNTYPLYSAVTYVNEPADLWEKGIDKKFRHRAPRVVTIGKTQQWVVEDSVPLSDARAIEETIVSSDYLYATSYVRELEQDGIAGAVIYPTIARLGYRCLEKELLSAVARTYNDWIIEFCRTYPKRLKAIAMLNVDDPDEAVQELERTAKMGAAGVTIPLLNLAKQRYDHLQYEGLWSAAEALNIPISLLPGTLRKAKKSRRPFGLRSIKKDDSLGRLIHQTLSILSLRIVLLSIILSGVFARHPNLRIVTVGFGADWAPYFMTRTDEMYEVRPERMGPSDSDRHSDDYDRFEMAQERLGFSFPEGERPSDHFRRNVYIAFHDDLVGFHLPSLMGIKNLLWGSAYPQRESTFPHSRKFLERQLKEMTEAERASFSGKNTATLYGF